MAASDHLGAQWMSLDQLKGLTSVDAEAENDYRVDRGEPPMDTHVSSILPRKHAEIAGDPQRYGALRESMQTQGQTVPLAVNAGYLLNGGHRLAMAEQLGWKGLHVTSDHEASEDRVWNKANPRAAWD